MRTLSAAVILVTSLALAAGASALDHARSFDASLGGDVGTLQKTLTCPERWVDSAGKTPTGVSYTTSRCAPSDAQIYVANGKVFALGLKLEAGLDSRTSKISFKALKNELTAAKGKVDDRGQLLIGRCDGKAAIVLLNWDSKTNTDSISMLYGVADQLLPMVGAR
jgi:hypothetical protein